MKSKFRVKATSYFCVKEENKVWFSTKEEAEKYAKDNREAYKRGGIYKGV